MNIAEFITARLAEDEAAAEAAEGTCHFDGSSEDADHYERHDPARVLREITAKRAILADHQIKPAAYPDPEDKDFGCQRCRPRRCRYRSRLARP